MLWPTDSALQALPPERQAWLYHEDHRDKLAAILRGHVIRNTEVGGPWALVPTVGAQPACPALTAAHLHRPWHLTCPTWAHCTPCMGTLSRSPAAVPGR